MQAAPVTNAFKCAEVGWPARAAWSILCPNKIACFVLSIVERAARTEYQPVQWQTIIYWLRIFYRRVQCVDVPQRSPVFSTRMRKNVCCVQAGQELANFRNDGSKLLATHICVDSIGFATQI